jgi:hypothetical protein
VSESFVSHHSLKHFDQHDRVKTVLPVDLVGGDSKRRSWKQADPLPVSDGASGTAQLRSKSADRHARDPLAVNETNDTSTSVHPHAAIVP